jgi:hypothetical protein
MMNRERIDPRRANVQHARYDKSGGALIHDAPTSSMRVMGL